MPERTSEEIREITKLALKRMGFGEEGPPHHSVEWWENVRIRAIENLKREHPNPWDPKIEQPIVNPRTAKLRFRPRG